jgi:hypothetical protein
MNNLDHCLFLKKSLIEKMNILKQVMIEKLKPLIELRLFILTVIGVMSFSNFIFVLFGQTIPSIIWTFFKDVGEMVIVGAVFTFALAWMLKSKPHNKPKKYSIMVFDVYGNESHIDGVRTEFKIHDVAWSYMKQYKLSYPLYNFALITDNPTSNKKTIFRYI